MKYTIGLICNMNKYLKQNVKIIIGVSQKLTTTKKILDLEQIRL